MSLARRALRSSWSSPARAGAARAGTSPATHQAASTSRARRASPRTGVENAAAPALRAIEYFSAHPGFHLYGYGWGDRLEEAEQNVSDVLGIVYRGETLDKLATLSRYRFALCFENTRFPGYVTEKIFDSFFAGTIPVYYGAPDITDFVPEGTFVDFSRYGSYEALEERLRGFREDEAARTFDAIRSFLRSEAFGKFTEDHFARSLVAVFRDVAVREGLM